MHLGLYYLMEIHLEKKKAPQRMTELHLAGAVVEELKIGMQTRKQDGDEYEKL